MKTELKESVAIPEGVTVTVDGALIKIKGPKGELSKKVGTKMIPVKVEGQEAVFLCDKATKRHKRIIKTNRSHVRNMFRGVTEGHFYKLKICSGHFPMTVTLKDNVLEVKNFIGESVPRTLKLLPDVDVKIQGQDITVESVSKELAGRQAAAIELLMRRPGFDKRIFQDGIYIVEKDGKQV